MGKDLSLSSRLCLGISVMLRGEITGWELGISDIFIIVPQNGKIGIGFPLSQTHIWEELGFLLVKRTLLLL